MRKVRTSCGPSRPITNMNDPTDPLTPALFVHLGKPLVGVAFAPRGSTRSRSGRHHETSLMYAIDQSPAGVLKRIRLLNGDQSRELLKGRVRVIK
jgi:hypothetical protein